MREFESRWLKLPEVQVVGLQQVKNTLVSLVATAQTMIAAVAVIAVIVALIGVINTILMSVYERTSEIGIMKALGARRGSIFQLIWLETVMICLVGAVAGSVIAIVGSGLVEQSDQSDGRSRSVRIDSADYAGPDRLRADRGDGSWILRRTLSGVARVVDAACRSDRQRSLICRTSLSKRTA